METELLEDVNFKTLVEELLQNEYEVIFIKNDDNIGEVTKFTPYQVVNLFEKIYGHITKIEIAYISKRAYLKIG